MKASSIAAALLAALASMNASAKSTYVCHWENGRSSGTETYVIDQERKTVNDMPAIRITSDLANFETTDAHIWIDLLSGSYTASGRNGTVIEASAGACHLKPEFSFRYGLPYHDKNAGRPGH